MSTVTVDKTGVLVVGGTRVFPIVLSEGPPPGRNAPNGRNGLAEVAAAGVGFIRSGTADWSAGAADRQIAAERNLLDAFADHGLHGWTRLADLTNLPPQTDAPRAFLLAKVVNALKGHRGLGIWKGVDEPANPFRPAPVPAAGLVRGHQLLRRELDQRHPNVIIQAPRGTAAELARYRPAFDITGADVYPVSYPPGVHAGKRGKRPRPRRRRDQEDGGRGRVEAGLDDAADRLERHRAVEDEPRARAALPVAARRALHGLPGDRRRRPRPRLLRRAHDAGDDARATPSSAGTGRSGSSCCAR